MENVRNVEEDFKEKEENCEDVIVVCGEDIHHLHSWRLVQKSNFFKTALDIPMKEKREKKIEVKEVDSAIFHCVITYIYHGTLEFDKETQLENILDAADRFDMEELKHEIRNQLKEDIDKDNVLDMANLAQLYNANMLLCNCIEYVIKENVTLKIEDAKKYPNVFTEIIGKLNKDHDVMKNKLKEAEDNLEEKQKELQDLKKEIDGQEYDEDYYDNSDQSRSDITTDDESSGFI